MSHRLKLLLVAGILERSGLEPPLLTLEVTETALMNDQEELIAILERLRGLGVDHRTDIFSLGAVLYEMLTGQRAFRGDSAIEIMNSILKEEPPEITSLVGALPIGLDRVVRHCLEKAVDARFQSASDLAFDLEAQSLYSGPLSSAASQARPVNWRRLWPIAAAAALVAAAVLGVALGRTWFAGAEPPTPAYSQLTFRKGAVHSARFAPDGQTVVYSAAWDGKESNLFLVRPGNPETRSLDMPETHVLAISKSGEMAVVREGTLSRVALTGGSPRAVLENVEGADWSPTGRDELAVVHWANGKFRLEYPIGTVRYESDTVLMSPRFSPDGKHIAFFNHPIKGDDRGRVMVATVDGPTRVVSEGWSSLGGLAWSPTGNEIWFAGARTGANRSIHAATIDGESRLISSVAGSLYLLDVTPDGRALVARESHRMEIMARTRGEAAERELAWLDGSLATDISGDGTTMLFSELNHGGGTNYSVYLRKTDGSPAVRLGDGNGTSLSPDGRFALSILPTTPPQIVMLPTGPGESRVLVSGGLDQIATARWCPDGRRVVVVGQEAGKAWRSYVVDVATGSLAPLTPENIKGALVTPDGTRLAAHDGTANRWVLYSLESGTIAPIAGLGEDEGPIQWSDDGRTIFIRETKQFPTRIFRLNPASGTREQVAELRPPDLTGVKPYPRSIVVTDDGKTYAYTYMRAASELYMLEGCTEWCREGLDSSFLSAMGGPA